MKILSKFFIISVMMLLTSSLIAQQGFMNRTGTVMPVKQELIQTIHGPTVFVEKPMEGMAKAAGDDCSNPIVIGGLPYADYNQTTTGRGNNYANTCMNDFDGGEDIIYQLTLMTAQTIIVSLDPKGTLHTGIALSDGCPLEGTCLAISYDLYGDGDPHGFTVTLDAGVYYIMADTWPNPVSIPDFDLTIGTGSLAQNDDCGSATEIGEVINLPFNTYNATDDGPLTCVDGANIWFNYTAGFTGNAVVSLCGSDYDTQLGVWDGDICPPVTLLACNDDFCGIDFLQSMVVIPVVEGNVYKIEVGGFFGDTGDGLLSVYEEVPCIVECPGGATPEGEACGDDINGGCNMAVPAFTDVTDGTVICGNLWSLLGTRDTDWFQLVLTEARNVKMTVESEAATVFGMVGQVELGYPGCENITQFLSTYKIVEPCNPDFIENMLLPAGTYYYFIGLNDYYSFPCPGVDYTAEFTVEEIPTGTIAGLVIDGITSLGIEGVKIQAGDYYIKYTEANGGYVLNVPVGTYSVTADGFDLGYSTETQNNIVVNENLITLVDFVLDKLATPTLLSAVPGIESITLTWEPIGADNGKILSGDIACNSEYVPSSTMDLDFTMTIYSPDLEWADFCRMTFPAGMVPLSATDLNGVPATITGQELTYNGIFYDVYNPVELDFSVNVQVGAISGPQGIPYFVDEFEYGQGAASFDGIVVVYEEGGAYVPTFNVYRQKGREYILLANDLTDLSLTDILVPGGEEWCYFVRQILPDGNESGASNILCATPLTLPGSLCEDAFDYGMVNNPAMTGTLIRDTDARWYKFEVPYTMDVAISLCNSGFDTQLALFGDCSDFNGTLPTSVVDPQGQLAYNGNSLNWCESNRSQIEYQFLPGGTYYAVVYGDNGEFGDYEIRITQIQILIIRNGWSGISTYMNPIGSTNIADVLDNTTDSLIVVVAHNPYGIYWPSQNINSIGNISPEKGYKAKMKSNSLFKRTELIYGSEIVNKTVNLPQGTSYLPVKVTGLTDANDIVNALGSSLLLLFDMNTNQVIWPGGGILPGNIGSLDYLIPGHAYMINMVQAASYTYPMPVLGPLNESGHATERGNKTTWNDIINTGITHFVSIAQSAQAEFISGDVIGVFTPSGHCVGMADYNGAQNIFIPANGDDEYTVENDGLIAGEEMKYKLFRTTDNSVFELKPTYSTLMPNADGMFEANGMSLITGFKLSGVGINDISMSSLSIYPNPAKGIFTIAGLETETQLSITNARGTQVYQQTISETTQVNLTHLPKGVYFVKLTNTGAVRTEKIVIQ